MKILLVEDDVQQEEAIVDAIRKEFPEIQIETICTELDFRQSLESIATAPPDLIILDIMIRWTDPRADMVPQPDDVKKETYLVAGIRCEKLLRSRPETELIPVVFYSILEHERDLSNKIPLRPNLNCYLTKGSDPKPLIDKVRYWKETLGL